MSTSSPSAAAAPPTLASLPLEILQSITARLAPEDLKRFRRVCRAAEAGALRAFAKKCFTYRKVYLHEHSLHILSVISQDEGLRQNIRGVTLQKRSDLVGGHCELCWRPVLPVRSTCSDIDYTNAWLDWELDTAEHLIECLVRLPSLERLYIESHIAAFKPRRQEQNNRQARCIEDRNTAMDYKHNTQFFQTILEAVATKQIGLKALWADEVFLDDNRLWRMVNSCDKQAFQSITYLDITAVGPVQSYGIHHTDGLVLMLERMPDLRSLRIGIYRHPATYNGRRFCTQPPIRFARYPFQVISHLGGNEQLELRNLRFLELENAKLSTETLIKFLGPCMSTLEHLRLDRVAFEPNPDRSSTLIAFTTFLSWLARYFQSLKRLELCDLLIDRKCLLFHRQSPYRGPYYAIGMGSMIPHYMIRFYGPEILHFLHLTLRDRDALVQALKQLCGEI